MPVREDHTFDSADERCAAWLFRPDADGPQPCVVLAHGFSGVRDQRLDAFAERFASAGIAALVFDYRHFGDSEGEPRQLLDIERQLADWQAAIGYARSLPGIDPNRIALWGTSFSGGHVVETAARHGGIAAVVSQVPFTDGLSALRAAGPRGVFHLTMAGLRDQLRAVRGREPFRIKAVGPPRTVAAMTAPEAEPGFIGITGPGSTWRNAYSARVGLRLGLYRPYARLEAARCPVLVCVADSDQTTPSDPAARAAEAAPNAELVHLGDIGHFDPYVGEAFERNVAAQADFLCRALGLSPPEPGQPSRQPAPPARAGGSP